MSETTDEKMPPPEASTPSSAPATAKKVTKKRKKRKKKKAGGLGKEENMLKQAREWLDGLSVQDILKNDLFQEEEVAKLQQQFSSHDPFPAIQIKDFMDETYCKNLAAELQNLDFNKKKNDLYEFVQSNDLKGVSLPLIKKFKDVLYSEEFRNILQRITGVECSALEDSVSISCAVYQDTHRLLCHDDELAGRRIAYIMYLVPEDWKEEDGGTLDLFGVDENGDPNAIKTRFVPDWNSFAFFEVSPKSFHQVAEVLSSKNRLSISGWFHGTPFERPPRTMDALPLFRAVSDCTKSFSSEDYIARQYRKKGIIKKINKRFMNESSIELFDFLRKDKFDVLLDALNQAKWEEVGPWNKRHYDTLCLEGEDKSPVHELETYMSSPAFAAHVSSMTGLEMLQVSTEVRRVTPGSYTLAHDFNPENKESGLDVVFTAVGGEGGKWQPTWGGTTHYLVENEDEELLSVDPKQNTLAIVYRAGGGVLQFLSYVNHHASVPLYQVVCTFRVPEEEESEDEGDEGDEGDSEEDEDQDEPMNPKE